MTPSKMLSLLLVIPGNYTFDVTVVYTPYPVNTIFGPRQTQEEEEKNDKGVLGARSCGDEGVGEEEEEGRA